MSRETAGLVAIVLLTIFLVLMIYWLARLIGWATRNKARGLVGTRR